MTANRDTIWRQLQEAQAACAAMAEALRKIAKTRFGWDGDCGVTTIAENALDANPGQPILDELARLRKIADAAWRLRNHKYVEWSYAGGQNECKHRVGDFTPCPRCDQDTVDAARRSQKGVGE